MKVFDINDDETAFSFYYYIEGTSGFDKALYDVSKKYNVVKAIYDYDKSLGWIKGDMFEDEIILRMVERGIIKEGDYQSIEDEIDKDMQNLVDNGEAKWVKHTRRFKDGWIDKFELEML